MTTLFNSFRDDPKSYLEKCELMKRIALAGVAEALAKAQEEVEDEDDTECD